MHPYLTERPTCQRAEHANRFIDLTDRYDVNDLLFVSSVLITDYSSVVYEASILNLPMLFYAFDLESYCKERDFYCDYASFVPGRIVRTMEELTHALQTEDYQQEKVAPFYTRNFDDTAEKQPKMWCTLPKSCCIFPRITYPYKFPVTETVHV